MIMKRIVLVATLSLGALLTARPAAAAPETPISSGTVTLAGKALFAVTERAASFTPEDRAAAISARLREIAWEHGLQGRRTELRPDDGSVDLVLAGRIVMTVTEADAKAERTDLDTLARRRADSLDAALSEFRDERSPESLARGAAFALLGIVVLFGSLRLLGTYLPAAKAAVHSHRGTIPGLRIQRLELIPGTRVADFAVGALDVAHKGLIVLLFYIFVPLVLSLFPWTRSWSESIVAHALDPLMAIGTAAVNYVPKLFFIVVVLAVVRYLLKFVHLIVPEIERGSLVIRGFHPEWAATTFQIARFLIFAFTAVVIFPYLPGSGSPAFRGISVFLGVLLSLGGGSAISNVVSGTILTYMRPFAVGDRVKIAETVGDVTEKSLLLTRVRTIKNVDVTIPNSIILGAHIVNYSSAAKTHGLILNTTVTIGYDAPWRKVHEIMLAAAKDVDGVLADPKPFILQTDLGNFSVAYELNAYTREAGRMASLYSRLRENLQDRFAEAGIEIMSPTFQVYRDGPADTTPRGAPFRKPPAA